MIGRSPALQTRRFFAHVTFALLLFLLQPAPLGAQEPTPAPPRRAAHWGLMSGLGYMGLLGTAGAGIGALSDNIEGVLGGAALGGVVGLVAGGAAGRATSDDINEGRAVPPARARVVLVGTLFAGLPIAYATSFLLINGRDASDTPLGSDESTVAILMGAGVAFGAYYLYRHGGELSAPRVTVGRHRSARDGRFAYDVGMRLSF
jgi:hypothetical protein